MTNEMGSPPDHTAAAEAVCAFLREQLPEFEVEAKADGWSELHRFAVRAVSDGSKARVLVITWETFEDHDSEWIRSALVEREVVRALRDRPGARLKLSTDGTVHAESGQ